MRYPTWTEGATLLAICLIIYGLLLPLPQERRRAELLRIAENWIPEAEIEIENHEFLSQDADILGNWSRGTSRCGSELRLARTDKPSVYRAVFKTGNCAGGCTWEAIAMRDGERLTLSAPVADVWDDAFQTFWIVEAEGTDCLIPMTSTSEFNVAMADGEAGWRFHVFTRDHRSPAK